MAGFNNATLIGRMTKDPELRQTTTGKSVCSFVLAVDRPLSNEQKEQAQQNGQQTADFINCTAWNKQAEYLCQYAQRGSQVLASGRIQTRSYDQDGRKVYVTEIIARDVQVIGSARASGTLAMEYENSSYQETYESKKDSGREITGNQMYSDLPF